jgi:hypothetical protein
MVAHRVNETDVAIERHIARIPRSPADTGLKVLTTSANHSLLWFAIAAALASRRGVTRRAAPHGVLAIGGASCLTNTVAKPLLPRRPAADALPNWRTLPDPPTRFGKRQPIRVRRGRGPVSGLPPRLTDPPFRNQGLQINSTLS